MRILIVQDTDWIRRNPIQHTHLAERMALRGHEIRVIDYEILWREEGKKELISKRQEFHVSRIMKGADIIVIRPSILKIPILDYASMLFTYKMEINRQMREFKPDVVLGNDIITPLLAYGAAKKHGIPTIFYAIDIEHRLIPFKFLQPLGKLIEKKNIRDADLVISINEGLREYTVRMGAKPEKTIVIRAGVDFNRFNHGIDGKEVRERYGIAEDNLLLMFVGWIYPFSGLKEVISEMAKVKDDKLKLMIVGDGDAFSDLQEQVRNLGLDERVILTGKQPFDDVPKFIAAADICLLPAYNNEIMRDIVPIKMYDYMAMGKPIIATNLPGIIKEFGANNGVTYIDSPEHALTAAMDLYHSDHFRKQGIDAKKFVENLDWDTITDKFQISLDELQ